ncbi:MAG: PilX N-terminal domain-containing pilus assembly protein [Gammaproteobacteria bacterium]|nr:PilX N-terminal domain-containing pilus assembly protein [Gammaproteobacteria bacterium]
MKFQQQRGVALVLGLVMLLVLTIMGVSSMSNTTLELKIACNSQTHNDAFQATLSCINTSILQVDRGGTWPQAFDCAIAGTNTTASTSVDYLGCQRIYGGSLEKASFENIYSVQSTGIANGCGGQATSRVVQAIGLKSAQDCTAE